MIMTRNHFRQAIEAGIAATYIPEHAAARLRLIADKATNVGTNFAHAPETPGDVIVDYVDHYGVRGCPLSQAGLAYAETENPTWDYKTFYGVYDQVVISAVGDAYDFREHRVDIVG